MVAVVVFWLVELDVIDREFVELDEADFVLVLDVLDCVAAVVLELVVAIAVEVLLLVLVLEASTLR